MKTDGRRLDEMTGYLTYDAVSARNDELRRDADLHRRAALRSGAHKKRRSAQLFTYPLSGRPRVA
jgi:hypothetical protein